MWLQLPKCHLSLLQSAVNSQDKSHMSQTHNTFWICFRTRMFLGKNYSIRKKFCVLFFNDSLKVASHWFPSPFFFLLLYMSFYFINQMHCSSINQTWEYPYRAIGHPELEGIHKDHQSPALEFCFSVLQSNCTHCLRGGKKRESESRISFWPKQLRFSISSATETWKAQVRTGQQPPTAETPFLAIFSPKFVCVSIYGLFDQI